MEDWYLDLWKGWKMERSVGVQGEGEVPFYRRGRVCHLEFSAATSDLSHGLRLGELTLDTGHFCLRLLHLIDDMCVALLVVCRWWRCCWGM